MFNMVFKAILCNKHNTDMHHTDNYVWLCDNACIYALGIQRVQNGTGSILYNVATKLRGMHNIMVSMRASPAIIIMATSWRTFVKVL